MDMIFNKYKRMIVFILLFTNCIYIFDYSFGALFAFANAGIHLHGKVLEVLTHPISLGIGFGLILGKFIGIVLFSRILVAFKLAKLPEAVNWNQVYGVAFLAGIGFTMSLFINELAFTNEEFIYTAKVGILFSSLIAGIIGSLILIKNQTLKTI